MHKHMRWIHGTVLALAAILICHSASAALPVTGMPVNSLASFDQSMQSFMASYSIDAGVLAVSRNGVIIYQRGFGTLYQNPNTYSLPENTPFRIASCEKPLTSAAIRMLVADWGLTWNERLFNLGQNPPGVLNFVPWPALGDQNLKNVTVQEAFNHEGGWDESTAAIGDPQFKAIFIANAMGIQSPPGRANTTRYMLGQPLQYPPGTLGCTDPNGNPILCYSNFGYMVLGEVIEQWTGMSDWQFVNKYVLTPDMWVPSTEVFFGHSMILNAREPAYEGGTGCANVYNPNGPTVQCPYGGWDQDSFLGHGNLVASAAPLLTYMNYYQVDVGGGAGTPLNGSAPYGFAHAGSLDGENSVMFQRSDKINIVVFFNKRLPNDNPHLAYTESLNISNLIDAMIAGQAPFPTFAVDGFWTDFTAPAGLEVGGYDEPFRSMNTALASTTDGTKLRFKPGTSTWTGTINKKMLLDSPFGTTRVGG